MISTPSLRLRGAHGIAAVTMLIAYATSWRALREAALVAPARFPSARIASAVLGWEAWCVLGVFGCACVLFGFRRGGAWSTLGASLGLSLAATLDLATLPEPGASSSVAIAFLAYAFGRHVLGSGTVAHPEQLATEAALGVSAGLLVVGALWPLMAGNPLVDGPAFAEGARRAATRGAQELRPLRAFVAEQPLWCEVASAALFAGQLGGIALLAPRARAAYAGVATLGAACMALLLGTFTGPALAGLLVLIFGGSAPTEEPTGEPAEPVQPTAPSALTP
ncbi:MAG: hypothetical protein KC593_20230 [Myxococcales bacterium]|nr:hypothetical protein [Myxococcales bacterium]